MQRIILGALAATLIGGAALADSGPVARIYPAPTAFIATSAAVPPGYTTVYLSGLTPAPTSPPAAGVAPVYGNTETQAESVFSKIDAALAAQRVGAGDVVSMHVFLVGDPEKGGKMDFAGMMAAYGRHFGTPAQPNKPTRTTVQVVSLVGPGQMIEVDCIAVKKAP
jgi:enamine deaminase RidA (YjgF/YER057c/UK114 family)